LSAELEACQPSWTGAAALAITRAAAGSSAWHAKWVLQQLAQLMLDWALVPPFRRRSGADWGEMLTSGRDQFALAPWLSLAIFLGLAIVITVLSIDLGGVDLRDALDPALATLTP
jgi:hypothetical protein